MEIPLGAQNSIDWKSAFMFLFDERSSLETLDLAAFRISALHQLFDFSYFNIFVFQHCQTFIVLILVSRLSQKSYSCPNAYHTIREEFKGTLCCKRCYLEKYRTNVQS